MVAEDVIIKPIVTEKSATSQAQGKYTFKVNKKATKVDIKKAVEKLFGVKVISVNTAIIKGGLRNRNGRQYKAADYKKAVVKIATEIKPLTYKAKGGKDVKASKKFNTEIKEATM
jgi:large subunit ribosomal protein L23